LLRTELMYDDTVPPLTFVITLNRVKIRDSASAPLWLVSLRPLLRRRNRGRVALFCWGAQCCLCPHFLVVLNFTFQLNTYSFTRVASIFLGIDICDHLALSFSRPHISTVDQQLLVCYLLLPSQRQRWCSGSQHSSQDVCRRPTSVLV